MHTTQLKPLSNRKVMPVLPPERSMKYAQWEKLWSTISAAEMRISPVASDCTAAVVLYRWGIAPAQQNRIRPKTRLMTTEKAVSFQQ